MSHLNTTEAAGPSGSYTSEVADPAKSSKKAKVKTSKNYTKDVAGPSKMSTIVEEPCCSKSLPSAINNVSNYSVEETDK